MANKPTAQLVPRRVCIIAAATLFWMTSSHLQRRIWSMISRRDRMMMVRRGAQIQEPSWPQKQASKSLNWSFKRKLPDSSDTMKWSETLLLVSLQITNNAWMMMTMLLGYVSTITLCILPLQAPSPIGHVQPATQLPISQCEDGMPWLDGCSRICVVGGDLSALWRVDGWVIIWSFLVTFQVSFWCLVYFIITSFIFMHEGLCWEFTMWGLIVETFVLGKGIVVAIWLHAWLSCNW